VDDRTIIGIVIIGFDAPLIFILARRIRHLRHASEASSEDERPIHP
jgi:hypothetical protein